MIIVPGIVRRKAEVAGADAWLADIDDVIDRAATRWDLDVGDVLDGGTEALVLAVTIREIGRPAVLKACIPQPGDHGSREIAALRHAAGRGCAELLYADDAAGVFVVERLGPSVDALALPIDVRHEIMCAAAAAMWTPLTAQAAQPFMTGAAKGRWLADFIVDAWERLGHPCNEAAIESALDCAARRVAAHSAERSVLVHGDVHQWNTLATLDGTGFKLIDPDGMFAEPEYDLGIIMREDPVELLTELRTDPRQRSRRLAALTGCNETAIWEWGVVERVSTGLLCTEIGLDDVGRDMLDVAEVVASMR